MGLYVRLSRRPGADLLSELLGGVLRVLEPLAERLRVERVGVYLGVPVSTGEEGQALVESVGGEGLRGLREALAAARRLLDGINPEARAGLLDVFVRIDLVVVGGKASFPAYLLVTNSEPHLELESLEWVHGGSVVESLEEGLEVSGVGVERAYEMLGRIGVLREMGVPVAAAALGPPGSLHDLAAAAARWLTSCRELPRALLETIDRRAESGDPLSKTARDYLYPYRRGVLADLLYAGGALRDYLYALQEEGLLRIREGRGLTLIEPQPLRTLNRFYAAMLERVVIPYARNVIQRRYQEFRAESLRALAAIYATRA